MVLAICEDIKILEATLLANTFITLFKIVIPLGIILFASIDVLKAVSGKNESDIKRAQSMIPKRLIAALVAFLIPTLVTVTINLVDDNFEFTSCFTNATEENIEKIKVNMVYSKIAEIETLLKDTESRSTDLYLMIEDANTIVTKLNTEEKIYELEQKILTLRLEVDKRKKIEHDNIEVGETVKLRDDAYQAKDESKKPGGGATSPGNGTLPYYNQCIGEWSNQIFYTGIYCKQACGATSLAMVAAGIGSNKNTTPLDIGNTMKSQGLPAPFETHELYTNQTFLSTFGLKSTRINTGSNKDATMKGIVEALTAGHPVIANVPNHYIVFDHIKDGQIHVLDPGRSEFNNYYTVDGAWNLIADYDSRVSNGVYSAVFAYFYFESAG